MQSGYVCVCITFSVFLPVLLLRPNGVLCFAGSFGWYRCELRERVGSGRWMLTEVQPITSLCGMRCCHDLLMVDTVQNDVIIAFLDVLVNVMLLERKDKSIYTTIFIYSLWGFCCSVSVAILGSVITHLTC